MVTALFRLFVIKLLFVFTIPDCECIHKGFLQASVNDKELNFGTWANIGYKTNYNFKNGEIVNCEFLVKTTNNFRMEYSQSNNVKIFDTRQLKNKSFFRALMTEKQNGYYIDISIERQAYLYQYRLIFILTDGSLPEEPVMVNGLGLFPKPEQNVSGRISYLYYYTEGEIPLVDNIFWDDGSMIAPTYGSKNLTGTDKKSNPVQLELRPDTDCNGARMSGFHRKNILYQYSQTIDGETNPVCEIHYKYKENDRLNLTCVSGDSNYMEINWVPPGKPANETAPYKSVYLYTSKLFTLSARDNLSTIKCELKYKYSVSAPITETIVKLFMSPNEQRWLPVDPDWITGGLLILCFVIIFIGFIIYLKKRRKSPVAPSSNERLDSNPQRRQLPIPWEGISDTYNTYTYDYVEPSSSRLKFKKLNITKGNLKPICENIATNRTCNERFSCRTSSNELPYETLYSYAK